MVISIGTGWLMISLKNGSLSRILLSHSTRSSGRLGFHQNSPLSAICKAYFPDSTLSAVPNFIAACGDIHGYGFDADEALGNLPGG